MRPAATQRDSPPQQPAAGTDGESPISAGPVDVTVVEPRMAIAKSMSPDPAAPGQTITVTLTVGNTGTSEAFDVIVEDPLNSAHLDSATVDPEEVRKDAVRTFALIEDPALKLKLTTPRP